MNLKTKIGEEERIQKSVVDANIEIKHLRRNVQSLRDELENNKLLKKNEFKSRC